VLVAGLLTTTSALTGALAGFAGGVVWTVLLGPPLNAWSSATLLACVLALDAVGSRRVPPLSVQRQVPQLWGRIFSAPVVAVLYGARLGVGPLTILRTWLWWGAFLAGASAGPGWGAAVGALFGAVRIVAMLVVGVRAGSLARRERTVSVVLAAAVVVAVASLAAGIDARDDGGASSAPALDADDGRPPGRVVDPESSPTTAATTSTTTAPDGSAGLASALPDVLLPRWTRADDDPARHLGPLDLAAAAAAEQDSTAERALLETRHFQRGHARGWRGPDGQVGYASVYEFASAADASAYLVDGVETISARGARLYDVESPAGAKGFSQAGRGESSATVSHGVVFVRGARFVLVFVTGTDSSVDPGDAAAAARAVEGSVGAG
jgi:hypothetical protein